MKINWFVVLTLITLSFLFSACAPATNPDSIATEIPVGDPPADIDGLQEYINPGEYCPDTWTDQNIVSNNGKIPESKRISQEIIGDLRATQLWRVSLSEVDINDRVVSVVTWNVVQKITDASGESEYVQELNPDRWINRAKEIKEKSPDLSISIVATWQFNQAYEQYIWDYTGECSVVPVSK